MKTAQPPSPMLFREPKEEMTLIQGEIPDSINEWYVAKALEKLEIPFMFHYTIFGGTMVRGGQVVDFVVFTAIGSIPVYVEGTWWHQYRNDPEHEIKMAAARHYFKNEPIILDEEETNSFENALKAVRDKVKV